MSARALGMACAGALFGLSGTALAWPVDRTIKLKPGEEKFERAPALTWADVADPAILSAEPMPGDELFLTPLKGGETLVLLYAEGKMAVWRIRVGPTAKGTTASAAAKDTPASAPLPPSCPSTREDGRLAIQVKADACRQALLAHFRGDGLHAPDVAVTFEAAALQGQLKAISRALEKTTPGISVKYVGAGLVLEGKATAAEHRKALWEVFRNSVGRVALDDRVEVASESP